MTGWKILEYVLVVAATIALAVLFVTGGRT